MKKKYSYIGVVFIILLFGAYVVRNFGSRLDNDELLDDSRLNKIEKKSKKADLYTFSEVPGFEFINQHGDTITNTSYLGKVYVVEFFFTTCPTICPKMNAKMLEIQAQFRNEDAFGIASISITPDIDTPEVMKSYAENNGITHKNWNLLTGKSAEVVYALSNKGFKLYAGKGEESHGGFEHSGLFALVDKKGFIRSRMDDYGNPIMYYRALQEQGFNHQIRELKEDIKLLLDE